MPEGGDRLSACESREAELSCCRFRRRAKISHVPPKLSGPIGHESDGDLVLGAVGAATALVVIAALYFTWLAVILPNTEMISAVSRPLGMFGY